MSGNRPPIASAALAALAGGTLGSLARGAAELAAHASGQPAWISRVAVNVVGGFLIGCWYGRSRPGAGNPFMPAGDARTALREDRWVAGFLGGFTTISGYATDVASAAGSGSAVQAAVILGANAVAGIAACAAGFRAARATRR